MIVTRLIALMTMSNHILRNALCSTFVKNEVLSYKAVFEAFFSHLSSVFNDASLQLVNFRKASVLQPGLCFLAANPTSAVHNDILGLAALEHSFYQFYFLSEGVNIRCKRTFEMPHFTLVMVAHINQDGIVF